MYFTTIAWRNLIRRPLRTLLTIAGLSVAVTAVVALVGIADGFERSYVDLFGDRKIDIIVQRASGEHNLNRGIDYSLGDRFRELPGVKEVFPGQMDVASFRDYNLDFVFVVGWEPQSRLMKRLTIVEGRALRPDDHNKVILGKVLAGNLGKKPHDSIKLNDEDVEVVGIFDSHTRFENGSIFMPLGELQRRMGTQLVTAFSISVEHPDDPAEAPRVAGEIEKLDPTLAALPVADFVSSIREIKLARSAAWAISAIALVIGAIGMANTIIMSVAERVREIGTLRAIGWTKLRVMSIIFCESILLCLGSAALGTGAAVALTHFLSKFPLTSGVIQGDIEPAVMMQGLLVTILVGMLGAAYPAFWGASMSPTEAMRRK